MLSATDRIPDTCTRGASSSCTSRRSSTIMQRSEAKIQHPAPFRCGLGQGSGPSRYPAEAGVQAARSKVDACGQNVYETIPAIHAHSSPLRQARPLDDYRDKQHASPIFLRGRPARLDNSIEVDARLAYLEKRRRGGGMSLLRRLFLGCFSSAPRSPGLGPSARPGSHLRSVPCAMDPLRQSAASLRSSQLAPVPLEQGPPIRPRNRAQARVRAAGLGGPARARPPNPGLEPDSRRGRAFGSPGDAGHASVPNYASPVAGAGASPVAGAGASPARGPSASGRARRCLAPALPRVAGLAAASNASPARGSPLKGVRPVGGALHPPGQQLLAQQAPAQHTHGAGARPTSPGPQCAGLLDPDSPPARPASRGAMAPDAGPPPRQPPSAKKRQVVMLPRPVAPRTRSTTEAGPAPLAAEPPRPPPPRSPRLNRAADMRLAVAEARREAQRAQRNALLQRVDPARLGRMLAAQAPGQPGSKRARQACAAADAADRERCATRERCSGWERCLGRERAAGRERATAPPREGADPQRAKRARPAKQSYVEELRGLVARLALDGQQGEVGDRVRAEGGRARAEGGRSRAALDAWPGVDAEVEHTMRGAGAASSGTALHVVVPPTPVLPGHDTYLETLQRLAQGLSVDPALLAACKAPSDAPWARHLAGAGAASPSDHPLPGSSQGSGEPACSPEGPGVGVVDLLTGDPWTGQSVALR
ncbi:hypothetical protein ACKKBG_A07940 [Auxenochlorella protothecoides x Auxenochlorella symbiontica]